MGKIILSYESGACKILEDEGNEIAYKLESMTAGSFVELTRECPNNNGVKLIELVDAVSGLTGIKKLEIYIDNQLVREISTIHNAFYRVYIDYSIIREEFHFDYVK